MSSSAKAIRSDSDRRLRLVRVCWPGFTPGSRRISYCVEDAFRVIPFTTFGAANAFYWKARRALEGRLTFHEAGRDGQVPFERRN